MASNIEYVPGVCNIGPAEIKQRMTIGYWGTAVTIVGFLILYFLNLPDWTRIILVIPAFMGATGFIQGLSHFCAGYGMEGMFNFSDKRSDAQKTPDKASAAKDRSRALQSFAYAVAIAVIVTVILYFV